ncbi:hypothetical protein NHX12_028290 [Muraenolepis orangiensis]|uniref:Uncharacterized protein n=1 Tax=Muraenolepis orangiensis TaxID=630683 RepID=A0A9Q0EDR3_9TELE|nr:hypothetical protein NHX12_028290 [Muraenolepis orangiensis]
MSPPSPMDCESLHKPQTQTHRGAPEILLSSSVGAWEEQATQSPMVTGDSIQYLTPSKMRIATLPRCLPKCPGRRGRPQVTGQDYGPFTADVLRHMSVSSAAPVYSEAVCSMYMLLL